MHEGQEFANIVGATRKRTDSEYFLSGTNVDSPIFHRTGIAAARRIDRQTLGIELEAHLRIRLNGFGYGIEDPHMFGRVVAERLSRC